MEGVSAGYDVGRVKSPSSEGEQGGSGSDVQALVARFENLCNLLPADENQSSTMGGEKLSISPQHQLGETTAQNASASSPKLSRNPKSPDHHVQLLRHTLTLPRGPCLAVKVEAPPDHVDWQLRLPHDQPQATPTVVPAFTVVTPAPTTDESSEDETPQETLPPIYVLPTAPLELSVGILDPGLAIPRRRVYGLPAAEKFVHRAAQERVPEPPRPPGGAEETTDIVYTAPVFLQRRPRPDGPVGVDAPVPTGRWGPTGPTGWWGSGLEEANLDAEPAHYL